MFLYIFNCALIILSCLYPAYLSVLISVIISFRVRFYAILD